MHVLIDLDLVIVRENVCLDMSCRLIHVVELIKLSKKVTLRINMSVLTHLHILLPCTCIFGAY